jgi:hypothetical protein
MSIPTVHWRNWIALLLALCAAGSALAQSGLGTIRLDNWGFFQRNADGSNQWQYRPRVFVPFDLGNAWIFQLRADVPMIYTNDSGPANPGGGYSGGIGNVLIEPIVDTPEIAPNLTLRTSLRFVFPSPKASPFGNDSQYQVAPGLGFTYKAPGSAVTVAPYVRYFWGFNAQSPGTTLVSSLNLFPTVTFGLNDHWSFVAYPENPITYNRNNGSWFVPFDFLFVNRLSKTFEFALGGAFKLGSPSNPSYDYIVDGRATFFF